MLFSFLSGVPCHSCTTYFLLFFFRRCFLSLLHRLFSLFPFQAVLPLTPAPPIFSFFSFRRCPCHSCTAYFLFFLFRRCFLSPLRRLFSIFLFQAVLHLPLAPPTFSFFFSGGASSHSCTAYFQFFLFRRCYTSLLHRLFSLFPFQAVLPLTLAPPTFFFSFSGGASSPPCTAYFLFFLFKRCYTSLLHRLLSLFLFQAVLPLTLAPPTFFFFLFKRCYLSLLHRLFSLFSFQAVLHLTLAPPTFSFSFSSGASSHSCTAYFLFFLFRWCFLSLLHRLLSLFLFQAVLHLTPAPPTFSFSFSGGATPPYSSVGAPKHFTPYYSSSQTPPTPHKKPPLSFDKGGSLNAQTIKTWPLPFNFASSITYTLILRS